MRRSHVYGNALTEYGLIGPLILVACMAALMTLGGNFNTDLLGIQQDMNAHHQAALEAQALAALNAQNGALASLLQNLSPQEKALLQADLQTKLQTSGANGTTELLARQLALTAQMLLQKGEITQSQSDILMRLANAGHELARAEALIQQGIDYAGGDYNTFKNMTLVFNGKSYTGAELAYAVGYDGPMGPTDVMTKDIIDASILSTSGPLLSNFLSLYQQAGSSGMMGNSTVNATVGSAATQIAYTGEAVEHSVYMFRNDLATLTNQQDLTKLNASLTTHANSSNICSAGNFQSNGVTCSK